jgi:hypothetical protein
LHLVLERNLALCRSEKRKKKGGGRQAHGNSSVVKLVGKEKLEGIARKTGQFKY